MKVYIVSSSYKNHPGSLSATPEQEWPYNNAVIKTLEDAKKFCELRADVELTWTHHNAHGQSWESNKVPWIVPGASYTFYIQEFTLMEAS